MDARTHQEIPEYLADEALTEEDRANIGVALLHGAHFIVWGSSSSETGFEVGCWLRADEGDSRWKDVSAPTRAAAARKYCIRHKLLPEVTDAAD
jgi:hypothetical protein